MTNGQNTEPMTQALEDKNQPFELASPNIILYGPPGTGKTYHTKTYALAAIARVDPETLKHTDREAINQAYQKLVEAERIQLVTFHQSFSYEDFIEGIKPDLHNEQRELRYVLSDGIFKRMCIRATHAIFLKDASTERPKRSAPARMTFDSLYLEFISVQAKLLSINVEVAFKSKSGQETRVLAINSRGNLLVTNQRGANIYTVSKNQLRKLYDVYSEVEQIRTINDDILRVTHGGNPTVYWTVFNELKEFEKAIEMDQHQPPDETGEEIDYTSQARMMENFDLSKISPKSLQQADRYVLIIDEINRGNISQIFGELITLIEPDKRAGMAEALTVQLPYSKTSFAVPPNVILIGTMNTADRSTEALDTALRRRFTFLEMNPDYALLEATFGTKKGIHVAKLLKTINERIGKLIGKEYQLGHAYFMSLKSANDLAGLKAIFQNRILPLLQEYFYNNYGKIELVIGEDFFVKGSQQSGTAFFAESNYEARDELAEYRHYQLRDIQGMSEEAFQKAIIRMYQR